MDASVDCGGDKIAPAKDNVKAQLNVTCRTLEYNIKDICKAIEKLREAEARSCPK